MPQTSPMNWTYLFMSFMIMSWLTSMIISKSSNMFFKKNNIMLMSKKIKWMW